MPKSRHKQSSSSTEARRVAAVVRRIKRRHKRLKARIGVLPESWPLIRRDRER